MSLIHNKDGKCNEEEWLQAPVKNSFQDISTLNKQWNINCLNQCLFLSISLSYIAWGSVLISKEIYSKSSCQNHVRWWLERYSKVWNRIHGGGIYNVEFLKVFFYILSQILDKDLCPRIIPQGIRRQIAKVTGNFFASFRKHHLDFLAEF